MMDSLTQKNQVCVHINTRVGCPWKKNLMAELFKTKRKIGQGYDASINWWLGLGASQLGCLSYHLWGCTSPVTQDYVSRFWQQTRNLNGNLTVFFQLNSQHPKMEGCHLFWISKREWPVAPNPTPSSRAPTPRAGRMPRPPVTDRVCGDTPETSQFRYQNVLSYM